MAGRDGVLLVGGGVGAVSVARRLRELGYDGPLRLVSDEGVAPYDRPPLSKQYLAGTVGLDELALIRPEQFAALEITSLTGRASKVSFAERSVHLDGGERLGYDHLVIGTGARARRLPFGAGLDGVHHLRTVADADRLAGELGPGRRVVVVGGGFIGLEVAATAQALGADVIVAESAAQPLTRVLGPSAGALVTELHADRVELRFGVAVTGLLGEDRVRAVCIDGEEVPADVVVVGIGALPNTEWLHGSGLAVDDGVLCDERGRTSEPGVYAVGDVARWRHGRTGATVRVEQWQSAVEQAGVVAANLAADLGVGDGTRPSWEAVPYFWSDQYQHKIQFCGRAGELSRLRVVRRGVVACFADDASGPVTGVLAVDNPAAVARGRRLVAAATPWPEAVAWLEAL